MHILSKLLFRKFKFVETLVLDEVGRLLESPWKELYKQQLDRINMVQRHADDKEVNLYCMKLGQTVPLPESYMFPVKTNEYPLASVLLSDSQANNKTEALLWVVRGRVFSINFNKSPKRLGKDISISSARLLTDLKIEQSSTDHLSNFVLPADYRQLVKGGDTTINDWRVLAPLNTRIVVQPSCNICVIAERNESAYIGVRADDKKGELVLFDFETNKETRLGTDLLAALAK